ncbi:hypothetical protein GKJPGBOP_02094 [Streptomyces paromomycinus]|uniref:Uncharacterized protein n=1 Tax=Streptomyces paromomycinus TaxID=92743 RepID=A0A401VZH8_STREY|nr:hypothetical protein GKJPGBOP_02094 [Streptomyces paromomycinus]
MRYGAGGAGKSAHPVKARMDGCEAPRTVRPPLRVPGITRAADGTAGVFEGGAVPGGIRLPPLCRRCPLRRRRLPPGLRFRPGPYARARVGPHRWTPVGRRRD